VKERTTKYQETPLLAATSLNFPLNVIALLCEAGSDLNAKTSGGWTAIMCAVKFGYCDIVDYLARRKGIDLSIKLKGDGLYTIMRKSTSMDDKKKELMRQTLAQHHITKKAKITKGFVSPLSGTSMSLKSDDVPLVNLTSMERFMIRVMDLPLDELRKEANKVNDEYGNSPLFISAINPYPLFVVKRLQLALPSSVDKQSFNGSSPIMYSAYGGSVEHVDLLAEMGANLSLKANNGDDVFDWIDASEASAEMKAAIKKKLKTHGAVRYHMPAGLQSKFYFKGGEGEHYLTNLKEQNWLNRRNLAMIISRVYAWSLANQIESDVYRTFPSDVSPLGLFILKCWFDAAGGGIGNGVGRIIMSFACGFNSSKSPFALIGMPCEGKVADNRTRCYNCIQPIATKPFVCCGNVVYCSTNCHKLNWRNHKSACLRKK
jgi:ankyrin repeat protein